MSDNINQNNPSRIVMIRKPVVLARTGLSDTTIWRGVRAGWFPAPVRLSPGTVGWRESDVNRWLETRSARG